MLHVGGPGFRRVIQSRYACGTGWFLAFQKVLVRDSFPDSSFPSCPLFQAWHFFRLVFQWLAQVSNSQSLCDSDTGASNPTAAASGSVFFFFIFQLLPQQHGGHFTRLRTTGKHGLLSGGASSELPMAVYAATCLSSPALGLFSLGGCSSNSAIIVAQPKQAAFRQADCDSQAIERSWAVAFEHSDVDCAQLHR